MAIEPANIHRFPADRLIIDGRRSVFDRNLRLLFRLKVGFSQQFLDALKDPTHPISRFFSSFHMGTQMENRHQAFYHTATWLTELSLKFDSLGGAPKMRIMSEKLHTPNRGRNFVLYFIEV